MYVYRVQYFAELKHTSTHKSFSFFFIKQKQMKLAKLGSFFRIYTKFFSFSCCLSSKLYPTLLRSHGLSMGFTWQEYWSGLPFPSPGDFPNPGIQPAAQALSPALQTGPLPLSHQGSLNFSRHSLLCNDYPAPQIEPFLRGINDL